MADIVGTVAPSDREARLDEVSQYVQQNVDPNSWRDSGGDVGGVTVDLARCVLHVRQTPDNQRRIAAVLAELRAAMATYGRPQVQAATLVRP